MTLGLQCQSGVVLIGMSELLFPNQAIFRAVFGFTL